MRPKILLLPALALAPLLACGDESPSAPSVQTEEPASIVFYSRRGGTLAKLYMMKPDGSGIEALTDGGGNDLWPDLSPDGRRVVFASNRGGDNDIYVLELASRTVTSLGRDPADDNWPRWSPAGRQIAFHSNRGGNYDIFVMAADGSNLRRVTRDPALDQWPDWSPDGRRLAFRRANDIHVADAAGEDQNVVQLTFLPTTIDQMPAWSPNGRQIYFMSFRPSTSGDVELFAIGADGRDLVRLTNSPGEDGGPQTR
jgi:Tol biopolymer transport system component